jgi:beta-N-acetylhexosaminidase
MSWAEQTFKELTLEQKVGQLIITRGLYFIDSMEEMLKEGLLGGIGAVVVRQVCKKDPVKLTEYLNKLYRISKIPPFMYLDAETGICDMFYDVGTSFPTQMAIAATEDPELSYDVAKAIAKEAKALGFDIISNPVLDINSNPNNPIIGTRSFGDNTDTVIRFGESYIDGMQSQRIIPNGKHFPGHGDTAVDSHIAMPIVDRSREILDNMELRPFRELIKKGMKGLMTAHIYFPALQEGEEPGTPATLSRKIMTGLLKEEWGFQGLSITDSLTMRAIKDRYGIEQAAVLAFKAGNDMILQDYNSDPMITFNALLKAVKEGDIDMKQVDAAVMKILKYKEWALVHERKEISYDTTEKLMSVKEHIELSKKIADKSVTLLENRTLPLKATDGGRKTLVIATASDAGLTAAKDMATLITQKFYHFYNSVKKYAEQAELYLVNEDPTKEQLTYIDQNCSRYDDIIFITFVRILSYKEGSGTIPESQVKLLNILKEKNRSVSAVIAGNPYVASKMPETDNLLCTYSDNIYSLDTAADILYGIKNAQGKLPVTISDKYSYGYGL